MPFVYHFRLELYILTGWISVLLLLFLAGLLLSRLTLTKVYSERPAGPLETGGGERLVRLLYRAVIALTAVCFYLSIPLLIALIAGLAAGIIYGFFKARTMPLRLVIITAVSVALFVVKPLIVISSSASRLIDRDVTIPISSRIGEYLTLTSFV